MMRLSRLRRMVSKKRFIIGGLALLVVLIGSYILWSKYTWEQVTPHYTEWHKSIRSNIEKISALPSTSVKEQDAILVELVKLSQGIDTERRSACRVNSLVQWQRNVISEFNQAQVSCQKMTDRAVSLQKRLDAVISYSKDEQALAKVITAIPQASELADNTWENQIAAWDESIKAAEHMSVTDTFKPTRQLAIAHMNAVKAAWQEVIAAHQAKDKQKYQAAQASLAAAIDGLDEVSVASQKTFVKLSSELEAASQLILSQ